MSNLGGEENNGVRNAVSYRSKKRIKIPLVNFNYSHGCVDNAEDDTKNESIYIGRNKVLKEILSLLSKTKRGSYLVSGYRGVGKTSVVERAIKKYDNIIKPESKKIGDHIIYIIHFILRLFILFPPQKSILVRVNLGHRANLKSTEIFYTITNILNDKVKNIFNLWHQGLYLGSIILSIIAFSIMAYYGYKTIIFDIAINRLIIEAVLFLFVSSFGYFLLSAYLRHRIIKPIETLNSRISYVITNEFKATGAIKPLSFGVNRSKQTKPLTAREAELGLINILTYLKDAWYVKADVIFIFDEIDKLSLTDSSVEVKENEIEMGRNVESIRNKEIDTLLGNIKYFITTAQARFFFIAGRDTLDRYYSERGSANSLYESIFDKVYEVPSLLTDRSDKKNTQISSMIETYVCSQLLNETDLYDKRTGTLKIESYKKLTLNAYNQKIKNKNLEGKSEEPEDKYYERINNILVLRNFIYYLSFHSWGNPRRLSAIFEFFVKKNKDKGGEFNLVFSVEDQRSFILAADIFTLFQHQLSREVSRIGDKITVSALSSLQFILRLHRVGFTRESLYRMADAINIHRSTELNAIVDDLLNHVFRSYIRRVRNGMYRFRFNSGIEQEIRYTSHIDDFESASYNFSLDAMRKVKLYFQRDLEFAKINKASNLSVKSNITLGDMSAIEQSYNEAAGYYSAAASCLRELILSDHEVKKIKKTKIYFPEAESIVLYVETMLKYADLEEHRQNYNKAMALYMQVNIFVEKVVKEYKDIKKAMKKGDSKWDVLRQPYWATKYISLKKSPLTEYDEDEKNIKLPTDLYRDNDQRFYYRKGELYYYLGNTCGAIEAFACSIHCSKQKVDGLDLDTERSCYMTGCSLVNIAESIFIHKAKNTQIDTYSENDEVQDVNSELRYFINGLFDESTNSIDCPVSDGDDETGIDYIGELISKYTGNPITILEKAAKEFENTSLNAHAAFTYIKLIGFISLMLDNFTNKTINYLTIDIEEINKKIEGYKLKALYCINLSRELESSQFLKTTEFRDFNGVDDLSHAPYRNIFNLDLSLLFGQSHSEGVVGVYSQKNSMIWQHSIFGQRLLANYIWWHRVYCKLNDKFKEELFYPENIPVFSIRSHIYLSWQFARFNSNKLFLVLKENNGEFEFAHKTLNYEKQKGEVDREFSETWMSFYEVARTLYFVSKDIRLISRNNLDLVFPLMSQVYYVQWKLLKNLIDLLMKYTNYGNNFENNTRYYSKIVQNMLMTYVVEGDKATDIAPTFFDFEYITNKTLSNLDDVENLVDRTSRIRTSILQQKYFFHDDHSDSGFHMDWTLAHMFVPAAKRLKKELLKVIKLDKNKDE